MQSTAALPFGTIVIILAIWALITIPLTIAGGIVGKNTRTEFKATCRTNKCALPPDFHCWAMDFAIVVLF